MCHATNMVKIAIVFAVAMFLGCESKPPRFTGGDYPPVTKEQLTGSVLSLRTGRQKFDFSWTFEANSFVVEGPEIPPDLVAALLSPNAAVSRIEGTWEIRDETIYFYVETGEAESMSIREAFLPIFFTGVIRIQTSEAQYVF